MSMFSETPKLIHAALTACGIITMSRERGLFHSPTYSRHSVLSPRSLDKNSAKQDGGFMFGETMKKQCHTCLEKKPLCEFTKNKRRKDGLNWDCKSCEHEKQRLWRVNNPDKAHAKDRRNYISHVDKERERKRKYSRRYRASNPDKVRETKQRWYAANSERTSKRTTAWQKAHPEKKMEYSQRRRALKAGNGGRITSKEWLWLKEFYNFTCLCCGRKEPEIKLTLDHVVPLSKGGSNTIENAQPLCLSCNDRKNNKHIDYRKPLLLGTEG